MQECKQRAHRPAFLAHCPLAAIKRSVTTSFAPRENRQFSENSIQKICKFSPINHLKVCRLQSPAIHVTSRCREEANKENIVIKLVHRFLQNDSGATSIEYAAIASLVSIVIVGAVAGLGSKLKASYDSVHSSLR
jgi:pilus assembly protein Flp/PilA